MAHFRRRYPKHRTPGRVKNMNSWPAAWDVMNHRRPARRRAKEITDKVLREVLDADDTCWDVHRTRPHVYYW